MGNFKERIKLYISKDEIGKAIDALLILLKDHEDHNSIIINSANYQSLKKERKTLPLTREEYRVDKNRIMLNILEIVDALNAKDFNKNEKEKQIEEKLGLLFLLIKPTGESTHEIKNGKRLFKNKFFIGLITLGIVSFIAFLIYQDSRQFDFMLDGRKYSYSDIEFDSGSNAVLFIGEGVFTNNEDKLKFAKQISLILKNENHEYGIVSINSKFDVNKDIIKYDKKQSITISKSNDKVNVIMDVIGGPACYTNAVFPSYFFDSEILEEEAIEFKNYFNFHMKHHEDCINPEKTGSILSTYRVEE